MGERIKKTGRMVGRTGRGTNGQIDGKMFIECIKTGNKTTNGKKEKKTPKNQEAERKHH